MSRGMLDIFDRHADGVGGDPFPTSYGSAVRGSLSYRDTLDAYRRYGAFLNVNTVRDSETMFSRRVFEVLACSTPVISTPSPGIDRLLGDHVVTVHSAGEAADALDDLVEHPGAWRRMGHRAYRHVHREHTYTQRMGEILEFAAVPSGQDVPGAALIIAAVSDVGEAQQIVTMAAEQETAPHTVALVVDARRLDAQSVREVAEGRCHVVGLDRRPTTGDLLDIARGLDDIRYAMLWQPEHLYGPHFVTDTLLAFDFARSPVVGKSAHYRADDYSRLTELEAGVSFGPAADLVAGSICIDLRAAGPSMGDRPGSSRGTVVPSAGYAIDPYNFVACGARSADERVRSEVFV